MRSKYILASVLFLFLLVGIQTAFSPITSVPLSGAQHLPAKPAVAPAAFLDLTFQNQLENRLTKTFGFREHAVRFYNQVLYSCFNEHNPQVIHFGDTLFEKGYIPTTQGIDFLGEPTIAMKMDSLKLCYTKLKDQGKELIVLIAPNKWRSMKKVVDHDVSTNYHRFKNALEKTDIPFIDALEYFELNGESSDYPLHSKQGTHWSIYGAYLTSLQLQEKLSSLGIKTPQINLDSMEFDKPRNTDKDLYDLLNVIWPPSAEELAYPQLSFDKTSEANALVIGDSYYWSMYYLGVHQGLFSPQSSFLYYNKTKVGQHQNERSPLLPKEVKGLVDNADVVLLVMSEPSLKWFGFGALGQI